MLPTDSEYYRHRAAAERLMASKAADPDIARIHEELARHYEELVHKPEGRGLLHAVG